MEYIFDLWNFNDLCYLVLNTLIIIFNTLEIVSLENQRYIASIATILMCYKFIDWFRLFDKTSFYINLIFSTIRGIKSFMLIMIMSYFTFGIIYYIIALSEPNRDVIAVDSNFWVFDAF